MKRLSCTPTFRCARSSVHTPPGLILFVVALALSTGCRSGRPGPERSPLAELVIEDLSGTPQPLHADGQVSIVNFWATWCGPCVAEMPDLQRLYDRFNNSLLQVVGISVDLLPGEEIKSFVDKIGVSYPVVVDDGTAEAAAGGLLGFPTTIILDQNGSEYRRILGASNEAELTAIVATLLESP